MSLKKISVRHMVLTGVLSGLAVILMLFSFPVPFAPSFYKLDLSEIVVAVGAFALGPVTGCIIELIKIILNQLINGSTTGGIGEAANFLMGCSFILPAAIIYNRNKNWKSAVIGLIIGTVSLTIVGGIVNYYLLLPVYAVVFKMPLESFIDMGNKINPNINSLATLVMFATVPFNLLKGVIVSVLTALLYPRLGRILHS